MSFIGNTYSLGHASDDSKNFCSESTKTCRKFRSQIRAEITTQSVRVTERTDGIDATV